MFSPSDLKILVTAHRGYGVNAKRRDEFIKNTIFYPENSLAAIKTPIADGADAVECDIHVSSEGTAMVTTHGDKIGSYCQIEKHHPITIATKKSAGDILCTDLTDAQIQSLPLKYQPRDTDIPPSARQVEDYRVPTLHELLELVAKTTANRHQINKPPLRLNIELKGTKGCYCNPLGHCQIQPHPNQKKPLIVNILFFLGVSIPMKLLLQKV